MKSIACIFAGFILLSLVSCSTSLYYKDVDSSNDCATKNGYWYNEKCWKQFEDEGIAAANIDKVVQEELSIIRQTQISINGKKFPITFFFPEMSDKSVVFLTLYKTEAGTRSIIVETPVKNLKSSEFEEDASLVAANILRLDKFTPEQLEKIQYAPGKMKIQIHDLEEMDISFSGLFSDSTQSHQVEYRVNETIMGAGTSNFKVVKNEAFLNGELGTHTYQQLKEIIEKHPEVKTIVLEKVQGSVNDAVNMHTGRILREAGLHTKVLANSEIASGGVDLFCAGKERIIEKGAKLGIHSWCCIDDLTAVEAPEDHPAHQYQIAYFSMCLGKDLGKHFYFHTLNAASFEEVRWMSPDEIKKYQIATQYLEAN